MDGGLDAKAGGGGGAAVGESRNESFQLSFNSSLKVDFKCSRVTSDGGLDTCAQMLRKNTRLTLYRGHEEIEMGGERVFSVTCVCNTKWLDAGLV